TPARRTRTRPSSRRNSNSNCNPHRSGLPGRIYEDGYAETSTVAEVKAKKQYHLGTGRRKTAVARVRITEGSGQISINGRPVEHYFPEDKDRAAVYGPLELTDMRSRLDVIINVRGGGFTGQAGAASQGIARALKEMFGLPTEAPAADGQAEGQEAA